MRTILRAILAAVLLLGGGAGDWAPVQASAVPAHESCCCGTPASSPASGMEDSCPCPKPEGNQAPSRSACAPRATVLAALAARRTSSERKTEPRPEPATWAEAFEGFDASEAAGSRLSRSSAWGRDPDLGRHLAHLATFRI